jgi:hypothetical protein
MAGRSRVRNLATLLGLACLLVLQSAPQAHATFPGTNGKLAFMSDLDLVIGEPGGNSFQTLVPNTNALGSPAWSRSGAKIAFAGDDAGDLDVFVTDAVGDGAGKTYKNLTPNTPGYDLEPAWSPTGSQLVYVHDTAAGDQLLTVPASGGTPTVLLAKAPSQGSANEPAWGASNLIAFVSNGQIYTIKSDGTGLKQLTKKGGNFQPSWSPDGTKIVYASNQDGDLELYAMNADGSNNQKLTDNGITDKEPVWSPDGTKIAWVSCSTPCSSPQVYVGSYIGQGLQGMTLAYSGHADQPDWAVLYTPPPPEQELTKVTKVEMHGHFAIVSFTQKQASKQASVWFWTWPKNKNSVLKFQFLQSATPKTAWTIQVNFLTPNTKYVMEIHLTNAAGDSVSPAYTYGVPVKTLQRNVKISIQNEHVFKDGEALGTDCGELEYDWGVDISGSWLRFADGEANGDFVGQCDGENWVPANGGVTPETLNLIHNWTHQNVVSDTMTVMMMAVDLDYDAGLPGNGFGTNGYGGAKNLADTIDWAEGKVSIDVGPKSFTPNGESFFVNGVQVEASGCHSTCIDVVWTFNFFVLYS